MTSTVEKLDGLERRLKVTVPKETVEKAYNNRIAKFTKTAKLKGFRPGKAPKQVIESQYGKGIRYEIAGELMQTGFEEAIKENELRIAGQPKIDQKPLDVNKELEFEATFEVYPEIKLKDLEGVSIEKIVADISAKNIEEMVDKVRRQHADWEDTDRACKDGDRVIIDFEGFVDDKPFEGGSAKEFKLDLGSKQMIPGFEEGIAGAKPAEERDITVSFPESYPVKDLAGKESIFKIKVHKVQQPKLPEVDEKFLEKISYKEGDVAAFRESVRKNMVTEVEQIIDEKFKGDVFDKLIEFNPIDLPKALVENEINHLHTMVKRQMAQQQGQQELPDMDLPRDPYVEQANRRVALGLIIGKVIEDNEIKADKEMVNNKVQDIAKSYPNPEQIVQWYTQNERMLAELEGVVLEEQAIAKLLETAQVKEKSISYDELMKLNQQGD